MYVQPIKSVNSTLQLRSLGLLDEEKENQAPSHCSDAEELGNQAPASASIELMRHARTRGESWQRFTRSEKQRLARA